MCRVTRLIRGNIRKMLQIYVHGMKANGFFVAAMLVVISQNRGFSQGLPNITSSTKRLKTKEDDIAHFTCTARDRLPLSITWKKAGTKLSDESLGIASLSWTNGTATESHLFIAVSGDKMRGHYTCVVSSESGTAKQVFVIEDQASQGLGSTELAAIGVGIGLTLFFVVVIMFFMWRGNRRLKKKNRGRNLSTHMKGEANSGMAEDGSVHGLDDEL